ncbi:MAG: hypothetical protein IKX45_04040 [Bacteroidales bacterium]|nr:hypothetical protein [Bacteroidales bacterium]
MNSVFTLLQSLQRGDYSVLDITPKELETICRALIDDIVNELRQSQKPYYSEYYLNKKAIQLSFDERDTAGYSRLELIINRLTLIDNLYSTQMWMRAYGIGELAEVISLFGDDNQLRNLFSIFLINHDLCSFDFLNHKRVYYRNGNNNGCSNLFQATFGIEANKKSNKRALSLISKYAYFLTSYNFPIYDSLVKQMLPSIWTICCTNEPIPPIKESFVDYVSAIDKLRLNLGDLSYDELDYILWSIGKIITGSPSLLLSMEDYLSVPRGFDIKNVNLLTLKFLKNNKLLQSVFELAQFVSACSGSTNSV